MKKFISILLLLSVLLAMWGSEDAYADGDGMPQTTEAVIKCGLYYGTGALISANLANEVGSGYLFGYFDDARNFQSVGYTVSEKITTMKDANMYMLDGKYYDSLPPSGSMAIGAYHVERPETFTSYDDALAFASAIGDSFPAYINGNWVVRSGNYTSSDAANEAASLVGGTAVGASRTCCTVVVTATGQILFEFDMGGTYYLGIMPTGAEKPTTWFKNITYFGGFEYRRNSANITVINVVPVGDYVKGVVPYEMGVNWPAEAMKAQAVCAASFARLNRNKHGSMGFDVCNTTDCQVYYGLRSSSDACNAACDAVRGLGLYYGNELCDTVYHSSNGGYTESSLNVWGIEHPYLQAVKDDFEDLSKAAYGHWSTTYTGSQLQWILNQKNYSIGKVVRAYVSEYTDAGNVYSVTFEDASGKKVTVSQDKARTIFSSPTLDKYARSLRYTIISSQESLNVYVNSSSGVTSVTGGTMAIGAGGNIVPVADAGTLYILSASGLETKTAAPQSGEPAFTVTGSGWGHNVGMSQWGARGRAEAGWTFEQILTYYYTGTHLEMMR